MRKGKRERGTGGRERGTGERKRGKEKGKGKGIEKRKRRKGKKKMVYQIYDTPFLRITYYIELICVDKIICLTHFQ